jgi:hypothetical protein
MNKKIITISIISLMIATVTIPALGSSITEGQSNNENVYEKPISNILKNNPKGYVFDFFYNLIFVRFPHAFPILKFVLINTGLIDKFVNKGTGTLVMQLTDAPGLNITEALVDISEVTVHYTGTCENDTNGTWITIVNETQTFDLIQLQDATEVLGEVNLSAGWYTQIRLYVDNALVTIDGEQYDLKIPSKKVKLITPFMVQDNETLTLTLDFDVQKSVHKNGKNKYIMRPTIKVIQE